MTVRTTRYPDPARSDIGATLFSTWKLPDPDGRQAALDAIARVWERDPWPAPGLLGYYVYEGEDGRTLLHHSQWTGEDAYEDFVRSHRQARVDEIDAAAPGIERIGLGRYRHYRSGSIDADARVPGCVVTVDVEFDVPEGGDPQLQRAWVDAVFEALESDPAPHPGGISAHFHLSTDGRSVLNYAEWESAQAHIDALESPGTGIGGPTPQWQRVQNFPGLKQSHLRRHTLALGLLPD